MQHSAAGDKPTIGLESREVCMTDEGHRSIHIALRDKYIDKETKEPGSLRGTGAREGPGHSRAARRHDPIHVPVTDFSSGRPQPKRDLPCTTGIGTARLSGTLPD